jgi:TRAP transporter TAXI family solute receptor
MNDGPPFPPRSAAARKCERAAGRWACGLGIALAILAALLPGARSADEPRFFRIGTAATSGTYFLIGGVLAGAISKPAGTRDCERGGSCGVAGLVAVAQATQGSIENLLAIGAGTMESGFAQSDLALWAYTGKGIPGSPRCRGAADTHAAPSGTQLLKNRGPIDTLRVIAALFPESVQIVVRADGPIHGLRDLKGKRVGMGEAASGTIADARLVLEAAGLSECDVKPQYLRLSRAVEALQNDEIDAFFLVGGAPVPAIAEIAALIPLRLIPVEGATLDKLMGHPPFFRSEVIPGGTYPGIDDPVMTVAVTALWVVGAAVPDDLVYAITRSLWQESTKRQLELASPVGKRINIAAALVETALPLHPGAARYYAERGMELPPHAAAR